MTTSTARATLLDTGMLHSLPQVDHVAPVLDTSAPLDRDLNGNDLSTLPAGLFDGLASLQSL